MSPCPGGLIGNPTLQVKAFLADPSAFAVSAAPEATASATEEAKEAPKAEEEEEEEEDEVIFCPWLTNFWLSQEAPSNAYRHSHLA